MRGSTSIPTSTSASTSDMNHRRIKMEIYRIQSAIPHDIVDFDSCPEIIVFVFNEKRCFSNLFLARVR